MAKDRTDNNSKESGIALVMALVITIVVMMIITSLTILFTKGFQTNVINRKFSTVYEAANGGVEYAMGVVNKTISSGTIPTDVQDLLSGAEETTLTAVVSCTSTTSVSTITVRTADGTYSMTSSIKCLGDRPLPGYGGTLKFPPPVSLGGGGVGQATKYIFYSVTAEAQETSSPENIARTESIYRLLQ